MIQANDILKLIRKKEVDQAEVFLSTAKSLKIDVYHQKVESIDEINNIGCGIRVIKAKKVGFAYTSDFDETVIDATIDQAIENAKSSEPDEFNLLPNNPTTQPPKPLELFDPKISETSVKEKIELALKIEDSAFKTDQRVKMSEKVSYSDSEVEVWIVNSNGLNVNYKANHCGGYAQIIAAQDGEMEAGFGLDFVKKFDDFRPEKAGEEAAQRAAGLLGAKPISSQMLPLILDPFIGTQLLEVLANALSSDAVQKGKSLFVNKLGDEVGSEVLSIIDNGRLQNGLVSAPFDGEGNPTQETKLIENGILRNLFFNTYTANKGKTRSTGNAFRDSFKSMPGIGPTNLYIPAGSQSAHEMIQSIGQGLYVQRVMGIHTANPISGDFSIGAAGYMIENGEKTYPVRGITIAGNLIEMLKAVEAVASDLRFITNIGSPTLLISGMTVGGH
jgi:PmbA protein